MNRIYASDWEQSSQNGVVARLTGCGCNTGCGTGCGCSAPTLPPVPPCTCPGPGPFPPCPCPGTGPTGPTGPQGYPGPDGPTGGLGLVRLLPKGNLGPVVPVQADFPDYAVPKVAAERTVQSGVNLRKAA